MTDAGKSTLIKLLIEFTKQSVEQRTGFQFPTPVVSLPNESTATSVDVHLYPDPASFFWVIAYPIC
jgi:hypothetical protein